MSTSIPTFDRARIKKRIREIHKGHFANQDLRNWLIKRFEKHDSLRLYEDPLDGMTDAELKDVKEYLDECFRPQTAREEIEEMLNAPPCCGGY